MKTGSLICSLIFLLYGETIEKENKVKYGIKVILAVLVIALAFNAMGCSRLFGPSDADVIKAIEDSGLLKSEGFKVTQPPVVVEKGKKTVDGSWPVKVRLSLTVTMANGQTKQMETTPTFRLLKVKDSTGKTVWKASL